MKALEDSERACSTLEGKCKREILPGSRSAVVGTAPLLFPVELSSRPLYWRHAPPIELGRSSLVSASSRLIDVKRPSVTLWNGDPGLKDDPLGFRMWRQVIWAVIPAGSCTISSFFFDTRPNETICVVNRPIIRRDFGFNYEHWPICRNCATDKPVENQVSTTIQVQ